MSSGELKKLAAKEGGLSRDGKIKVTWAKQKLKDPKTSACIKNQLNFVLKFARRGQSRRRQNPVETTKSQRIKNAIRKFEKFRLVDPEYIYEISVPALDVFLSIGECDAVEYTTVRGGKIEAYRHDFEGAVKPLIASSHDGQVLMILPGTFDFTERGIVDRE